PAAVSYAHRRSLSPSELQTPLCERDRFKHGALAGAVRPDNVSVRRQVCAQSSKPAISRELNVSDQGLVPVPSLDFGDPAEHVTPTTALGASAGPATEHRRVPARSGGGVDAPATMGR